MFNSRKLFDVIVSNFILSNKNIKSNKNLSDIRTYYNTISINNNIRFARFRPIRLNNNILDTIQFQF